MLKRRWLRLLLSVCALAALAVGVMSWNMRAEAHHLELDLALASAVKKDDLPQIQRLVAEGADPDTPTDYAPRPETFLDRIKRVIMRRPAPMNGNGETALFRAAAHGDIGLLRRLLAEHADPNRQVQPGYTPLHYAAGMADDYDVASDRKPLKGRASFDACRLLLEAGADPNIGDIFDGTPFRHAIYQKDEAIERLFLEQGAKWNYADRFTTTCFWDAVENERVWLVRKWLAEGANPNEKETRHGQNVLAMAVSYNNVEIVRMLLEAGANPNIQDDGQFMGSPLIEAVRNGKSREILRLLLKHGAKPDMTGGYMRKLKTPLQYAEEDGDEEVVGLLRAAMKQQKAPRK